MAEASTAKPGGDLDARADRIRETAKWLIVSFAGVGSVLVAGSKLSSLGSLELWSDRFLIALVGVAVALVAVIVAINLVSNVLVMDPLSLRSLAGSNDGTVLEIREELEGDDSLVPDGSLETLYADYREALSAQASPTRRIGTLSTRSRPMRQAWRMRWRLRRPPTPTHRRSRRSPRTSWPSRGS